MSKALDKAYLSIKQAVLDGTFKAGERLIEHKLVDLTGTSRTPVREAIKQLVADNYLVMKPNSGASVAIWSDRDLEDIFKLRAHTEAMIASRAAIQISQAEIDQLIDYTEQIDAILASPPPFDIPRFLDCNKSFHQVIINAAASPVLTQALARVTAPPIVYQVAHNFTHTELMRSNSHHREIIDSMIAGDGDWAYHCMQTHIMSAYNRMRNITKAAAISDAADQTQPSEKGDIL